MKYLRTMKSFTIILSIIFLAWPFGYKKYDESFSSEKQNILYLVHPQIQIEDRLSHCKKLHLEDNNMIISLTRVGCKF